MAKKKNKHPQRPRQPIPDNKAIYNLFGNDAQGAAAVANNLFGEGSLGRVDSGFDAQGNRVFENQDVLNRAAAMRNFYQVPGQNRSAEMQDVLNRNKSMLEGYSAPEFTAMHEQAAKGLNSQYATQAQQLMKAQARGGVRGAAGTAAQQELSRERGKSQADLEQGLFVKGAEAKRDALDKYSNLVGSTNESEYQRSVGTAKDYAAQLAAQRQDELARQQANLAQVGAEKAGNYGAYFGSLGLAQQNKSQRQQYRLGNKMLDLARAQYGRRGGKGPDVQGYVNEAKNL